MSDIGESSIVQKALTTVILESALSDITKDVLLNKEQRRASCVCGFLFYCGGFFVFWVSGYFFFFLSFGVVFCLDFLFAWLGLVFFFKYFPTLMLTRSFASRKQCERIHCFKVIAILH